MAHFAKLDDNNVVISVHVVNNDVITINGIESEEVGVDFLTGLHGHNRWKQTSYNSNFRKNYAGIGYVYDEQRDAFIAPKPYPSWVLNEETCLWQSPVSHPSDNGFYTWDEDAQNWIEVKH